MLISLMLCVLSSRPEVEERCTCNSTQCDPSGFPIGLALCGLEVMSNFTKMSMNLAGEYVHVCVCVRVYLLRCVRYNNSICECLYMFCLYVFVYM